MADSFVAISEDGVRFKLKRDGTWEPDIAPATGKERIRFRSSDWGDSVAQTKVAEKLEPLHEVSDYLLYEAQVGGFPANLSFQFVNDMLHTTYYDFKQEHADRNDFLADFESLKKLMSIKYGKEDEIKDFWHNELYRDDYAERGLAIAAGHHSIFVKWCDAETDIILQIAGDNYVISLGIIYRSKRLQVLADAALEQAKLVGL